MVVLLSEVDSLALAPLVQSNDFRKEKINKKSTKDPCYDKSEVFLSHMVQV